MVPLAFGQYLALADGTRTMDEIARIAVQEGAPAVPAGPLRDLFEQLDGLLMLENGAFTAERYRRLQAYRDAPHRVPALAGLSYPAKPEQLRQVLDAYASRNVSPQTAPGERLAGIVSPHIDYMRGGKCYARVWRDAAPDLKDVELFVIFGTDHNGSGPRLTLTRQSYSTPWGTLPTDLGLVERLAEALSSDPEVEDHPFADEFNHIGEHSIELASVWLHHVMGNRRVTVLPVLCGSLNDYVSGTGEAAGEPADLPHVAEAMAILKEVAAERRTVFVAAADLAHVGPAFGDRSRVTQAERERVKLADRWLLDAIARGDRDGFLASVRSVKDANRVCGLAPIYMTLWATGETCGKWMGYAQCAADDENGSFVSIAGAVLYRP